MGFITRLRKDWWTGSIVLKVHCELFSRKNPAGQATENPRSAEQAGVRLVALALHRSCPVCLLLPSSCSSKGRACTETREIPAGPVCAAHPTHMLGKSNLWRPDTAIRHRFCGQLCSSFSRKLLFSILLQGAACPGVCPPTHQPDTPCPCFPPTPGYPIPSPSQPQKSAYPGTSLHLKYEVTQRHLTIPSPSHWGLQDILFLGCFQPCFLGLPPVAGTMALEVGPLSLISQILNTDAKSIFILLF